MAEFIRQRTLPLIVIQDSSGNVLSIKLRPNAPYRSVERDPRCLEVRYMGMGATFSGSLQSLSDIAGAKLMVEYLPVETPPTSDTSVAESVDQEKADALFNEIQSGFEIPDLELSFDGQTYTFRPLTRVQSTEPGLVSFSMIVPSDLNELQEH